MSKHKHTEDPWVKDGLMVKSNSGRYIGYLEDFSDADAERVIACVNVCKNLANEQLNDLIQLGGLSLNMLDSVMKERDEYKTRLAALEELATALEADTDYGRPLEYTVEVLRDELIRTREALGMLPEQRRQGEYFYG